MINVVEKLRREFEREYGAQPRIFSAPGRVNLIGEHTDYNDGFVLPFAIDQRTYVAAAPTRDRRIRVRSLDVPGPHWFDLNEPGQPLRGEWSDYVEGTARVLAERGCRLSGADLLVTSEVPSGAGLSSSAALEVSVGFALLTLAGDPLDKVGLALAAQAAEHTYVGTLCGIMDQYVTSLASPGHALLIDCRSLTTESIRLDVNLAKILICDSGVKHSLASSAYNERRRECREGVELLGRELPGITALRDVTPQELARHAALLPAVIHKRCRHVVLENERTVQAAKLLTAGRMTEVGQLMNASHDSLRDDYEVSCEELDVLVEAARNAGAFGARMTGGGFGGCTVTLVGPDEVEGVREAMSERFQSRFGRIPRMFLPTPSGGAREDEVNYAR